MLEGAMSSILTIKIMYPEKNDEMKICPIFPRKLYICHQRNFNWGVIFLAKHFFKNRRFLLYFKYGLTLNSFPENQMSFSDPNFSILKNWTSFMQKNAWLVD